MSYSNGYYGDASRGGAYQPINYIISQTAASDGTATFLFDAVALSNTWTMTINCAGAPDTALFTAASGGTTFGQFKGSNSWGPLQLQGGDRLQITVTGLIPGTLYQFAGYGYCNTVNEPEIVYPTAYADSVTTSTQQIYLGKVKGSIGQKVFSIDNIELQPTWRSIWVAAVQLTPYTGTKFAAFAAGNQSGFKYAGNNVPYTASLNSFFVRIPLVSGMDTDVLLQATLTTGQISTQLTVYYGADLADVDMAVYPEGEFDVTVANTSSNPVNVNVVSGGGGGGDVTVVNTTSQPVPIQGVQGDGTQISITPGDASGTPLYVQIVGGSISYVPMGGDVTGNSNAATVVGIEGKLIATAPSAANQLLIYNGSTWNSTTGTGTGAPVLASSPTITTPTLSGNTTAGTINSTTIPSSSTLVTTSTIAANAVTTFSAGTTGLTPSTATNGAVTLAGTLAVANGGTGVTSSTGSGSTVLSNSPTLVTPALGTPASGVMTNVTGLPLTTGVTGILPVANGGLNASTTAVGSIPLGSSTTAYTPLAIGSTGTVLTSNGTTATWAAASGGSSVLNASYGSLPPSYWSSNATYQTIDPNLIAIASVAGGNTFITPTKGVVYYYAIYLPASTSPTKLTLNVQTAGSAATCLAGLYNSTTQIGYTASFTANSSGTTITQTLTATTTGSLTSLSAGVYFIGILVLNSSTTSPNFLAATAFAGGQLSGFGPVLTASTLTVQASKLGTGLNTIPTTISGTPTNNPVGLQWFGIL